MKYIYVVKRKRQGLPGSHVISYHTTLKSAMIAKINEEKYKLYDTDEFLVKEVILNDYKSKEDLK